MEASDRGESDVLARKPRPGDELDVRLDRLSPRGVGRGRVAVSAPGEGERTRPLTVEAPGGLPGERVRLAVERTKGKRIQGRIEALLEPSERRVTPRCRHFQRPGGEPGCGGCSFQSMAYPDQLEAKAALLERLLAPARLEAGRLRAPIGMADPWHYRNKMEFSFGWDRAGRFALGLHPPGDKYATLRLEECFLESPEAATLVRRVRDWAEGHGLEPYWPPSGTGFLQTLTIREGKRTGERMVELTTSAEESAEMDGAMTLAPEVAEAFRAFVVEVADEEGLELTSLYWTQHDAEKGRPTRWHHHRLHGHRFLREELHPTGQRPLAFEIAPRAFFQPNTFQAERLYDEIIRAAGEVDASMHVMDLYCGTGTIGMAFAQRVGRVTGVELQPEAVANARQSAGFNELDNVTFYVGDVGKVLRELGLGEQGAADVAVVDPPRRGLTPQALRQLDQLAPGRVVYVSCNPSALAEDLVQLQRAGWRAEYVQPVDLFPQTFHVESVVPLVRT